MRNVSSKEAVWCCVLVGNRFQFNVSTAQSQRNPPLPSLAADMWLLYTVILYTVILYTVNSSQPSGELLSGAQALA